MVFLGVNVDHVATIRQARGGKEPDPASAAALCMLHGADSITVHLREDRRHIQERDVRIIRQLVEKVNLEMACEQDMCDLALDIMPDAVTLVPEKREELTTEGGLDVAGNFEAIAEMTSRLSGSGIMVSHFVDPDITQVEASARAGAAAVELHTGCYANARSIENMTAELGKLETAARSVLQAGIFLHAGHGLNYLNVAPVAGLKGMRELNIGHSIISRAVFTGLEESVKEMKGLIGISCAE